MHKNTAYGFTLIELLVVISIIGLLSSVVLAALSGARDKARYASTLQFATANYRAFGASAIGYWNFDEGAGTLGAVPAQDASGNNRQMVNPTYPSLPFKTIRNAVGATPSGQGYSISHSGLGVDYGTVGNLPYASDLTPSSLTVSAWVNFKSAPSAKGTIVGTSLSGATQTYSPLVMYAGTDGLIHCQ